MSPQRNVESLQPLISFVPGFLFARRRRSHIGSCMIPTATILSGMRDTEGSDHGLDCNHAPKISARRATLRDTTDEEWALIELASARAGQP